MLQVNAAAGGHVVPAIAASRSVPSALSPERGISDVLNLNFHHLRIFWVITQAGGLTAAARQLNVSPSTLSTQLKELGAADGQSAVRAGEQEADADGDRARGS